MAKHTVKNITRGFRGLCLVSGESFTLDPGESLDDVEMTEAELDDARATGWFAIDDDPMDHDGNGEKGGSKPPAGDPASKDEIMNALSQLDDTNAEHWNADGKPKVAAVQALLPEGKTVTAAAIKEAAPDYKRDPNP